MAGGLKREGLVSCPLIWACTVWLARVPFTFNWDSWDGWAGRLKYVLLTFSGFIFR